MSKYVIWDLDGTILDSFGIFQEVLHEVTEKHSMAMPSEKFLRQHFHGSLESSISGALGGLNEDELEPLVRDFLRFQTKHYEVLDHHIFDDVLISMRKWHQVGARQILVTNRAHEGRLNASPRSIVEKSELSKYIDAIICGDDTHHRKPNPKVLGKLLDNIDRSNTVVVGDQYVDVQFALNLGTKGILVHRIDSEPAHLEKLEPNWQKSIQLVSSLEDVEL